MILDEESMSARATNGSHHYIVIISHIERNIASKTNSVLVPFFRTIRSKKTFVKSDSSG